MRTRNIKPSEYITADFARATLSWMTTIGGWLSATHQSKREKSSSKWITPYSSALILHDVYDNDTDATNEMHSKGAARFHCVQYALTALMLRLKKLYLDALLKTILCFKRWPVLMPISKFRYGYMVDFADIRAEFDKTTRHTLTNCRPNLMVKQYDNIFKTQEEIQHDLQLISKSYSCITQTTQVFSSRYPLRWQADCSSCVMRWNCTELYNTARLFGYDELSDKFNLISALYNEVSNHIW